MAKCEEIKKFAELFREKVEPFWGSDFLYEKFKPTADLHKSAGFCGPSSILLWSELTNTFPNESFTIAVGRVYCDSKEWIIGKHVWVVWHQGLKSATIIDITADQSKKIGTKIIFENIDELAKKDISYVAYQIAKSLDEVDEPPKRRAYIIREAINGQRKDVL